MDSVEEAQKELEYNRKINDGKTKIKSDVGRAMEAAMRRLFEHYGAKCPECGALMWRPKQRHPDGSPRPGACGVCGYMEPINGKSETKEQREKRLKFQAEKKSTKITAIAYYGAYSCFATELPQTARFTNFIVKTDQQRRAFNQAQAVANKLIHGELIHSFIVGTTGAGKTHLASAIAWQTLMAKQYRYKMIFIDWPGWIGKVKKAMNDPKTQVEVDKTLSEISLADLVIIDDIGAERKTDYTVEQIEKISRKREDKRLLLTTNLAAKELKEKYGQRIWSRFRVFLGDNTILMNDIPDYRVHQTKISK
jgi:DNA replication protein